VGAHLLWPQHSARWVDAAFAVHNDMRSHTGATMSLGKGSVYSTSTKQKINTKSSTEAELVGAYDSMTLALWTQKFMEAQGYHIGDNVIYQDNQSAMLLERNGRASSGRRTRHIDIRYFFINDRIHDGDLRVEYCPTEDMIGDFFTKPLQGSQFRKLRNMILNVGDDSIHTNGRPGNDQDAAQECVAAQCGTLSYADVVKGNDVAWSNAEEQRTTTNHGSLLFAN